MATAILWNLLHFWSLIFHVVGDTDLQYLMLVHHVFHLPQILEFQKYFNKILMSNTLYRNVPSERLSSMR